VVHADDFPLTLTSIFLKGWLADQLSLGVMPANRRIGLQLGHKARTASAVPGQKQVDALVRQQDGALESQRHGPGLQACRARRPGPTASHESVSRKCSGWVHGGNFTCRRCCPAARPGGSNTDNHRMFVHLRLHTEFSVVDSTCRIDEVV